MRRELGRAEKQFSALFSHRVLDRIAVHIAEICHQLEGEGPKARFAYTLSTTDKGQFCTDLSKVMLKALDIGQQVQDVRSQFHDLRADIERKLPPLADNEIALTSTTNAFSTDLADDDKD